MSATIPPLPGEHEPHDAHGLSSASRKAVDDAKETTGLETGILAIFKRVGQATEKAREGEKSRDNPSHR